MEIEKNLYRNVRETLCNIIDNTIYKYINASHGYPKRLTMVSMIYCPICCTDGKNCDIIPTPEWNGRFNNYGWVSCNECMKIINLAKQHYQYKKTNILSFNFYNPEIFKKNLFFWRVSSNKNKLPYLECGFHNECCNDLFYISNSKDRIYCQISWYDKKNRKDLFNIFMKGIPLSNLIYHNREIFGYNIQFFYKINNVLSIPEKFSGYFIKEYKKANIFSFAKKTFNLINNNYMDKRHYLPKPIKKIIFNYLFDVY